MANTRAERIRAVKENIKKRLTEVRAPSALEDLNSRLTNYAEQSSSFANQYASRYFDEEGNYINQYRDDSSDWLESVREKNNYLSSEADTIRNALERYKSYISEDSYKEISDMLATNSKALSEIYSHSSTDYDQWSQFGSEDEYKKALARLEEQEKLRTYDLDSGYKKIEDLKAEIKAKESEALPTYNPEDINLGEGWMAMDGGYRTEEEARDGMARRLNLQAAMDRDNLIRQLEKEIAAEEQYINKAGRVQNAYKLAAVADPESEHYDSDFEYYAQMGEAIENPSFDDAMYDAKIFNKWEIGGEEVQNKVKFAKENIDEYEARNTEYGNEEHFGVNPIYAEVNEKEYKTYNYYLAKDIENSKKGEKTNLADEYLESIEEDLNSRRGVKQGEAAKANGAAFETLFGLAAGVVNNVEGFKNYFSDEDYIPLSPTQVANQVVGEDMASKGKVAEIAYNTSNVIGNMLPSILVGSLTGGIGSAVGGTIGSAITVGGQVLGSGTVGLSSAGSAYQEMLNLGYNKEQARTYGTLVGASEATLQYLFGGISSLGGKVSGGAVTKALSKVDNALGRFAVKYAGAVGSEILEEEAQLWIEPFLKSAILDMDFDAPNIDEMLDTAIITFFSTGLLEGPGVVSGEIGTYKDGKTIKEEGKVNRLVELGKTFSADSVAHELANKVDENTGAYTIGRLLNEASASLSEQNKTDIKNALIEKGVSEDQAETLAKWMNHVVEGGNLTKKQQMALEANDVLAEVLYGTIMSSDSSVMQRGSLYNKLYGIASSMGVDRTTLEESQTPEAMTQRLAYKKAVSDELRRGADPRRGLSNEQLAEIDNFAAKRGTTIPEVNYQDVGQSVSKGPSAARIADVTDKVSDTGAAINTATGEDVSIKGIASIDTKNKTMMLELADGTKVDSKNIEYESEAQAALYESALEMGYTPQVANSIIQGYTPNSNISVEDYLFGTNEAFHYGWGHIPEKGRTGSSYKVLNKAQREHAVKVGEEARAADDKAREIKAAQNQPQTTNKKGKYGAKVVVSKGITDRVKASVEALDAVAKALKINITVDDLGGNAYGYYKASTNELIIDANAGGNHTLLFTASHELVHYIRNWSPSKFTVLADFLMEQYAAKGEDVDALIQAEINKAYKATRGKHQMTYNEAYEEVVAQAMQGFLTDSNFIERLAALQKKDASLAKRLVSKLKEILNNIRTAYQGVETKDRASQTVKEMGEAIDELYAKMEEGLIAASEASQTIGSRNLEDFSEAKTTDGKDLFQYKAMEEDEETYRQMLKKHGLMSDGEINKLFRTIDNALVIIKNNLEVLDYAWDVDIDDRSFSPVKPNSDNLYKVSLDFSTLCRKRILQQVIQTQLQDALNKPISREESIAIRDELMKIQEEGRQIEIACALCYVESARMKSPAQIKKFLKDRENVIKEFLASKSGGDIKQKIAKAEADARERLGVGNATLKSMPDKIADQIRAAKKEAKKAYTPTAEEQKFIDAAKSMSVTDFTSPEGLANLAKNYPVLFDAYTSFVRNATKSKGIEKDTWWRAGDSASIGDTLIANMNRENGLRSQSWSDFQVIHLLDYIAATIELSTRNAKEQAYSKVPDYIELMGNTGAMLNMSLIPMAKFNGKLEYDSVEGMAYKKALELREKYHATAGTICIGISDEQIKMLLDDSSIDYVIPYHKSGMAAHIRKLMHIPTWSEYEKYQNETNLSRSDALKQAKKYGVKLLGESDENYQKHTAFSEWFDIEEARQIAKQENAFPTDAKLQKKLGVMYGGYMAMQNAANNYLKLCAERGIAPKFSHENANFSEEANYWKLIIDRKMVDNVTGEIIEQQAIKPIFDEAEVLRILNDELERYPNVKADQDYATRTVVEKFLSGKMNDRLDPDTIAAIMQKPVDNITTTNIVASEDGIKAQYVDISQQLNDWLEGNGKAYGEYNGSYFDLGTTPDILLKHGAKKANLIMHDDVIVKVTGGKHNISLDEIAKLPVQLNDPILLFKGSVPKSFVALTEIMDKDGHDVIVAIHINRHENRNIVNEIRSLYSKTDDYGYNRIVNYVSNQIKSGNLIDASEKKASNWFTSRGLQLPKLVQTILDTKRIVPQDTNSVKANQENNDIHYQYADTDYAPTFYSQMGKVVEGVKQEKLAANSVVNMLRGKGVKAEEIRWSGIVQFLDGKKSVTKQELLDFINSSMFQIGEQSSSNDIDLRYDSSKHAYIHYDSNGNVVDTYTYNEFIGGYVSEASEEIYSNHYELQDALREEYGNMASPRWSEYKLDGGENYREIVFTMPNSSYSNRMMRTHWGDDAEGVLAHARIQDFDVNGKKMLFVEEIQSDWHNEGQSEGYSTKEYEDAVQSYDKLYAEYQKMDLALSKYIRSNDFMADAEDVRKKKTDWLRGKVDAAQKKYIDAKKVVNSLKEKGVGDTPDAPFKDTYHEFVMKRLLRMAAEEGYDSIGWTPAEIQSKRWSDEFAEGYRIEYDQEIPKFLRKYGRQWGAKVENTYLNKTEPTSENIREYAESLRNDASPALKLKYSGIKVWSMDITDSMKNSVLYDGQAMFQYKDIDAIDNRTLLAKALEGATKNDIEKTKLKEYQKKIELINAEEKKLRELRAQIKEISFSKGARDTEKLKKLQFEANQAANRINVYDKQLLRLEATKPLMDVVQREKDLVRKKMDQERKAAVKAAKEKDMATIREIMNRHTESRKKAVERRDMAQLRNKIRSFKERLEGNLLNPTDRGYVPFGLAQAIIDVCNLIDTDTDLYKKDGNINKSQEKRDQTKEKLQALKDEYEKLKDYVDTVYSGEFDEAIYYMLKDLKENFEGRNLKELSLDELQEMYYILRSIGDTLADARNLIGKGEAYDVYDAGYAIIEEQREVVQKRKKDKRSGVQKAKDWIINRSLAPVRNVERISGYKEDSVLVDLFNDFEVGVRQKNFFEMESKKGFETIITGKNAKAYESAIYDAFGNKEYVDDKGKKFSISKMQMMQAILSQDRERANKMNHIKGGGLAFADLNLLRKGNLKEAISTENSHLVSNADGVVEQFRQELADDKWAQEYMAAARGFFDGKAKDAINNTMLTLKHRIVAKDKNYIPFEVDKSFVVREISAANDIQQTINSYGMLQETKDKAPQPLIMTGLNNIVDRHIDQVSTVVGLAIPVRNFNKVWNVHSVDGVNTTVNGIVETNWGVEGRKFIEQVVQDIQGPRHNTQSELYKKIKSGYIGATFLLNGSVVTKQIGSLFAATSMLKWRDPASMMGNLLYTMVNYKKIAAEVDKYTASAWTRRQGMSDAEVYTLLTEGKKNRITKAINKLPAPLNPAKWITAMDSTVALSLWKYAKQDVQKAHPELSGEELNKATASFYDALIENTQSMTDVLHRPEIQKRSDILSEAFGMFKTDLYQMSGQLQNAVGRFGTNKSKENAKYLGRTVYSIAASAIWGSLMTTAFALLRYKVKPYRDDEDDELTVESWLKRLSFAFGGDLMGYILPLFGSEVVGTIENIVYGESEDIADSLALTAINDLYSTTVNIASSLKEGEAPSVDDYKKLLTKSLQVFGIPANNILRTIDAIRLHSEDIANGEFFSFEAGREKSNGQRLYEAILRGNEEQIEKLELEFADDDAVTAAIRKALRENDERITEAAQARLDGDLEEYESIAREIVSEGHFTQDDVVAAINAAMRQLEEDTEEDDASESEEDDDKATSYYSGSDINSALEKGDTTTALKVIDDIVQVKTENYIRDGYKKSEAKKKAESSVKSSVSSYWKPLYLEAKANKDLNEVLRIKKVLKATKLYDDVTKTTDEWWVAYKKAQK